MARITVFGTAWCGHCRRVKADLERAGIPFVTVDVDAEPEAAELVEFVNGGIRVVPTLLFDNGSTLTNPSLRDIREHLSG